MTPTSKTKRVPLTTNSLTEYVIGRIQSDGGDAWRINTTGIYDPTTGRMRKLKKEEKGKADVWGVLCGCIICVEIKFSKGDSQSDDQALFQQRIERAGGVYVIVKRPEDFDKFWSKYKRDRGIIPAIPVVIENQLLLI